MPKYLQCINTACKAIELAPKFSHQKTFLCAKCNAIKTSENLLYNSEEVLSINQIEEFLISKGFLKSPTGVLYKEYSDTLRISITNLTNTPSIVIKDKDVCQLYTDKKIYKHLPKNIVMEIKPVLNTIIKG